jgi:poly(A) polymerase
MASPFPWPGLAPLFQALPRARVVGGAVRDTIAGLPVADLDLATPDPPGRILDRLAAAGLRAIPTGLAHGTVTALVEGRPVEITTLRRDVATDGRHAEVEWTEDWRADAARRDFTINAMSMDQAGTVHDYFGGRDDLAAGRLRFVGDPATRLAEDWLRLLRYFRFYARYGREPPGAALRRTLAQAAPRLATLSPERVWSELRRILAAPDPTRAIEEMHRTGVLEAALPEGTDPARLARLVAAGAPPDPLLRLAALLAGDPDALAARLRLSGAEAERLAALRRTPSPPPEAKDAALRRALADHPADLLDGAAWLAEAAPGAPSHAALRARLAATPRPVFPLAGRDALALGARPGPELGQALAATRAWWIEGGCTASPEACRAELARRLSLGPS